MPPWVCPALAEYLDLITACYIPSSKSFFEVEKPLREVFFFEANPSKVRRLTVRHGGFGVCSMAAIYEEILVLVCGLSMMASLDPAILYVNPCF